MGETGQWKFEQNLIKNLKSYKFGEGERERGREGEREREREKERGSAKVTEERNGQGELKCRNTLWSFGHLRKA